MEFLQNHADRAIARHMLTVGALIVAAVVLVPMGLEILSFGDQLAAQIEGVAK